MKKTMYSAMKNLAEYIAASQSSDFDEIWDEWSSKYKPEDYMELPLRKMGMQLCQIDKAEIRLKSIEAMKDVANGKATKIFIPNNLTGSIGAAGVFGEAFREFNGVPGENEKEIRKKCVTKQIKKDACLDGEKSRTTYGAAMTNANIEHDLHDSAFDA